MNFLQIHPNHLQLHGITRTAAFYIKNKNDFLAASYNIEVTPLEQKQLSVFPQKGMLLGGQQQKVRVKYVGQNEESSISDAQAVIKVNYTFRTDYNKHNLNKNGMKSWDEVPAQIYCKQVEVLMGAERQLIQNCIKEDIVFTKTFGTDQLNISAIKQKQKSYIEDVSFDNLQIQSKPSQFADLFQQLQERAIEPNMSVVSQFKLDSPAASLYPLQYGESRLNPSDLQKSSSNLDRQKIKTIESRIINEQLNKSLQISMRTAQCQDFSDSHLNDSAVDHSNRAMELIILSVVAAFFVALGNNLGRVLG